MPLEPSDTDLIASQLRHHIPIVAAGLLLVLCGSGYIGWAALRFNPRASAAEHCGFDLPLNSLAGLYEPYRFALEHLRPTTDTEQMLLRGLQANMNFSVGMMMTILRIFFGLLLVLKGLFLCTIAFERRRLLQIIARLHR
jgi:hypothetical protein